MLLSSIALLLAFGFSSKAWADNRTTLPAQLGLYPVSVSTHELVTDRWDPLAPTTEKRRLMISVFRPRTKLKSCPKPTYLPYMPPATGKTWSGYLHGLVPSLPSDVVGRVQLASCNASSLATTSAQDAPLLVFSPGSGAARFLYDSYSQAIASSGYTVISIDHTYDSLLVEFPDGSQALRNTLWDFINTTTVARYDAANAPFIAPRAADMSSILDAVRDARIPGLEAYAKLPVRAIAYGQSLGGNTAVAAAEQDSRFIAAMDWDGNLFDPWVRNTTINIPTAFMASQQRWDTGRSQLTWNDDLWKNLKGWNSVFGINGTMHISVTDVPLIVDTLGLRTAEFNTSFGTITGKRVQNVVWSHSVSFFDFVFKGKKPTLLEGPSSQYPDVFFIREPK